MVASPKERNPPAGVDGQSTGGKRLALLEQPLGLAGLAKPPLLGESQLVVDRVVLQLDEIQVRGTDARLLERLAHCQGRLAVEGLSRRGEPCHRAPW